MKEVSRASESPRAYRSELRSLQAKETRRRIVAAAARRFAADGYQAATLAAIARDAGVATETVKSAASKAELLIAAFELTFAGEEGAGSLTETDAGAGVLDLPDDLFLDSVLVQITAANERGFGLWTVLLGAALSDPVVKTALDAILENRRADYVLLVNELMRRGYGPADDVGAAADSLSFLLSPEGYQQLCAQAGWTPTQYRDWLGDVVRALLN